MAVTKIQVILNGAPVEGATIIVGEIGELEKKTDEDGIAAYPNITGSYAGYTDYQIKNHETWKHIGEIKWVHGKD